jgi:sec-independent protein translocase protein TatB
VFDIGALEFVVLAIAALFIFGPDRLPDMARQAARGLRQLRSMAANARRELSRELGPEFEDLDIRDLNPRTFVRKHVLDVLDEEDLRFDRDLDLRDDLRLDSPPKKTSVRANGSGTSSGGDVASNSADATAASTNGTATATATDDTSADPPTPPFDTEAT